jgi:hypothetical protein
MFKKLDIFENYFIAIFNKEPKRLNTDACLDIPGECDNSVGLSCQGPVDSKSCQYLLHLFLFFRYFFQKYFLKDALRLSSGI